MTYLFTCPTCHERHEVVRHHTECSAPCFCSCGTAMVRLWTVPQVNVPNESKAKTRDMLKASADQGRPLIEVGNELKHIKRTESDIPYSNYDLDREAHQYINQACPELASLGE